MNKRVHNIVFALLLGAILGVTIYALHTRMPGWGVSSCAMRVPSVESKEPMSTTERMIDAGELSDHEAKYYKVLK